MLVAASHVRHVIDWACADVQTHGGWEARVEEVVGGIVIGQVSAPDSFHARTCVLTGLSLSRSSFCLAKDN